MGLEIPRLWDSNSTKSFEFCPSLHPRSPSAFPLGPTGLALTPSTMPPSLQNGHGVPAGHGASRIHSELMVPERPLHPPGPQVKPLPGKWRPPGGPEEVPSPCGPESSGLPLSTRWSPTPPMPHAHPGPSTGKRNLRSSENRGGGVGLKDGP